MKMKANHRVELLDRTLKFAIGELFEPKFVAAVERLPALHYSVDFIFLSLWIMGFIVEL